MRISRLNICTIAHGWHRCHEIFLCMYEVHHSTISKLAENILGWVRAGRWTNTQGGGGGHVQTGLGRKDERQENNKGMGKGTN